MCNLYPHPPLVLQCEVRDGKERCYFDDGFTREMCPEHVDSVFFSLAKGQWSCQPVRAHTSVA